MWDKSLYNKDGYEIILYSKENGRVPFEDFLFKFDLKMKARIIKCIDRLKELGPSIRPPVSKKLNRNIYELRILVDNSSTRVLYFFYYDRKIVLTHGFVKKTNKTPRIEIERANRYRTDWIRREENELRKIKK